VMPIWKLENQTQRLESLLEQDIDVKLLKMYLVLDFGVVRSGKKVIKIHSES
jgi:hypothetical protein